MSCPEIDVMRQQVCARLRGSVNAWEYNLQARYGDPRMYALQEQERNARQAALEHDLSRRSSKKLDETSYHQGTEAAKAAHGKRISKVIKTEREARSRGRRSSAKPPESEVAPLQTKPSPGTPAPAPPSAR